MIKKLVTIAAMCTFLYVPTVKAAVTVDWVVLTAALVGLFGEPRENPTVTDTSLRSICIHALGGNYYSFGGDEALIEGSEDTLGFNLHMCISQDTTKSPAFDKVCANKLKYDAFSSVNDEQDFGFYVCSEPVAE